MTAVKPSRTPQKVSRAKNKRPRVKKGADDIAERLDNIKLGEDDDEWKIYRENVRLDPTTGLIDSWSPPKTSTSMIKVVELLKNKVDKALPRVHTSSTTRVKMSLRHEDSAEYVPETGRFAYNNRTRNGKTNLRLMSDILTYIINHLKTPDDLKKFTSPRELYYGLDEKRYVERPTKKRPTKKLATKKRRETPLSVEDEEIIDNCRETPLSVKVRDIIDDLCCYWRCPRKAIGISYPPSTSSFAGCLVFEQCNVDGDIKSTDCSRDDWPYTVDLRALHALKASKTPAEFILLIEKDTAFDTLVRDSKFAQRYPCVLVSGKGQPDVQGREFVRLLYDSLKIPILILTDCNVYGLEIVKSYTISSYTMAFQSYHLTVPSIKYIGLSLNDIKRHGISLDELPDMPPKELKKATKMNKLEWIKNDKDIRTSLDWMLKFKKKADIEILEAKLGTGFLSSTFLPDKLEELGLIRS